MKNRTEPAMADAFDVVTYGRRQLSAARLDRSIFCAATKRHWE